MLCNEGVKVNHNANVPMRLVNAQSIASLQNGVRGQIAVRAVTDVFPVDMVSRLQPELSQ